MLLTAPRPPSPQDGLHQAALMPDHARRTLATVRFQPGWQGVQQEQCRAVMSPVRGRASSARQQYVALAWAPARTSFESRRPRPPPAFPQIQPQPFVRAVPGDMVRASASVCLQCARAVSFCPSPMHRARLLTRLLPLAKTTMPLPHLFCIADPAATVHHAWKCRRGR